MFVTKWQYFVITLQVLSLLGSIVTAGSLAYLALAARRLISAETIKNIVCDFLKSSSSSGSVSV